MLAAGLGLLVLLLLVPAAVAKVWFQDIEGRELRRGVRITTVITGCPGNPSCSAEVQGVTVLLRRDGDPGLRRLARINTDGRLRFRVPHVRLGRYRLMARVRIGDQRRLRAVSGRFLIVERRR